MASSEEIDLTRLRYVLYARKSTEDDTRQVRSIDDQIKDCRKLARELDLNVVEVVRETKSAKKPHQRALFDKMLKDLRAKKFDAILCWHPDRLSRNMLESGTIIDMLDENVLKDIRFHSHQFSNDANGKMLLGMLFVFSKQYSDDLSAKVTRGIKGNFQEGKSAGAAKHGYDRDPVSGLYVPNQFFDAIKEVWTMRLRGVSLEEITQFLRDEEYHRFTRNKYGVSRKILPSITITSRILRDPFYHGLLQQANQTVDLRQVQLDFKPMITQEEYEQVQALSYKLTRHIPSKQHKTFYPLHGFVYCGVCNGPTYMRVGKNKTGNGQYVLSYRCDNPGCTRKPKSLRAKNIFNSIYERLDKLELTDEAYDRYSKQLENLTDDKIISTRTAIQSRRGGL